MHCASVLSMLCKFPSPALCTSPTQIQGCCSSSFLSSSHPCADHTQGLCVGDRDKCQEQPPCWPSPARFHLELGLVSNGRGDWAPAALCPCRGVSMVAGRVTPCLGPFCFPAQTLGPQHPLYQKQGKAWVLWGKVNAFKTRDLVNDSTHHRGSISPSSGAQRRVW